MTVIDFDQYWLAITKIEAEEMLMKLTIADYPHLKPTRRKELYNRLKGYQGNGDTGNLMTPADIARAIGAING